jgi:hypothetical protein
MIAGAGLGPQLESDADAVPGIHQRDGVDEVSNLLVVVVSPQSKPQYSSLHLIGTVSDRIYGPLTPTVIRCRHNPAPSRDRVDAPFRALLPQRFSPDPR